MERFWLIGALLALGCDGATHLSGDDDPDGADDAANDVDGTGEDAGPDGIDGRDVIDTCCGPDDGSEVSAGCTAQDAFAVGDCEMELPGWKWDGAHCVRLGSGCSCGGADCGAVYDTAEACVSGRWTCYEAAGGGSCEPQPAALGTCLWCDAAIDLGFFWDGAQCFQLVGCDCVGSACGRGMTSLDECNAVHAGCAAEQCAAGGGQWFPMEAGFCGFRCGGPSESTCYAPYADCLCPDGQSFVTNAEGVAHCETDPGCTVRHRCFATGGTFHAADEGYCGFTCGVANERICESPFDSCDCGPHRNFESTLGCVADDGCGDVAASARCEATGGTWRDCEEDGEPCSCGDWNCGIPNTLDPCVMPGCDCGPLRNFYPPEGCVLDDSCVRRGPGVECAGSGTGGTHCRAGLVCCDDCGHWPGCSTCHEPCCPDDGSCGDNGCSLPTP